MRHSTHRPRLLIFLLSIAALLNGARFFALLKYQPVLAKYDTTIAPIWLIAGAGAWIMVFLFLIVSIWLGWGVSRRLAIPLLILYLLYSLFEGFV